MNNSSEETENDLPFYGDHRFLAMIITSIFIAFALISVSMAIYHSSGAAQLDLSRPGYKEVRSQVINKDETFSNFSNIGTINETVINDFKTLFDQQAKKAKEFDAFGSDPLDPNALWPPAQIINE